MTWSLTVPTHILAWNRVEKGIDDIAMPQCHGNSHTCNTQFFLSGDVVRHHDPRGKQQIHDQQT